jgi:tRNA pseudouridine38-40 synthase
MVRIMVGTLVEVGLGRVRPESINGMLAAKDRRTAGPTAPPQGLYLQWIRSKQTQHMEPPMNTDEHR